MYFVLLFSHRNGPQLALLRVSPFRWVACILRSLLSNATNFIHPQINFPCRRRGDRDNLLFGRFYRLDVPLYDGTGNTAR